MLKCSNYRKPVKTPGSKRKFAGVKKNAQKEALDSDKILAVDTFSTINLSTESVDDVPSVITADQLEDPNNSIETSVLSASSTMVIPSTTTPIAIDTSEQYFTESHQLSPSFENGPSHVIDSDITPPATNVTDSPIPSNLTVSQIIPGLTSPTTPSVPKERKRRIVIDDDDESPTFNPLRSNKKIRGKNSRSRNSLLKKRKGQLLSPSDKANENVVFTSPEGIVSTILRSEHLSSYYLT